jgi:hypothetical protein
MQQINQIEASDIERLDGVQLVRLLHTLLCAEARVRSISKSGIHVPFEINVKDGGSDGQWDGEIGQSDYIPNRLTFYQSKASAISPSDCENEMHKDGSTELKAQVARVLENGGAYVFFCSHAYNPDLINARLEKAREALKEAGRATWATDQIHFLDGTLIAQWTNQHAAALALVCRVTRIWQAVVLRDFLHWQADPLFEFEFQSNQQLDGFILELRSALSELGGIARITGPSGLGKTRLAFEVFNAPAKGEGEKVRDALAASVVYLDMQIFGGQVLGWVNQLALAGYLGVIVVDNCTRKDHQILQSFIGHRDCKLSLLTLDYVPETPFGDSILQIQLTPEIMRDVVPRILAAAPDLKGRLDDSAIQRISEFAHGFPQIAILTAQAGHALDLQRLNQQGEIANRLLWGWGTEDATAKEIIRCLAPFAEIGQSGNHEDQLAFVCSEICGGLSDYDFRRHTKQFTERRVLQAVGDFLMVAPPPLAVALAADWLEDISDARFNELLPKIEAAGLTASFCKRLRQLDFSSRAQKLCEKLMGPTGPFSLAEVLNSEVGSRVFRALVEVNPLEATNCLFRLYSALSPEEAKLVDLGRRNLVWSLEKLCWRAELFPRAARVVRAFAAGETEHWANNATALFRQLFHVHLSGTQCPATERLEVLREGLVNAHRESRLLCVDALGAALQWGRFSRSGGAEQMGTRPPERDWHPTTWSEIWDYWSQAFGLLRDAILQENDPELSEAAKAALGSRVGALVTCPLGKELYEDFKRICERIGNSWPSARDELKRIRSYHKPLSAEFAEVIDEWLALLTPSDLATRLVDIVSVPGWHQEELPDGGFKDLSEEAAIQLADELYASDTPWKEHLGVLLSGDQQQTHVFGRRCMELAPDPAALMRESLDFYKAIEPERRNAQLLRGMISKIAGTKDAEAVLDTVAEDPDLRGSLLVPLSTAATATIRDFDRVVDLVKAGELPPEVVDHFSFGGISQRFDAEEFRSTLTSLIDTIPSAAPAVLRLVSMFYFHDPERFEQMRDFVIRLLLMPEVIKHINGTMIGYSWKEAVQAILSAPPEGFVPDLAAVLADKADSGSIISYNYSSAAPVLRDLLQRFPKQAWPVFEARLRDEEGHPNYSLVDLLCQSGRLDDSGVPLWELDADDFRDWAKRNRDLMPYLLHHMPLYRIEHGAAPDASGPGSSEPPQQGIPIELPDPTGVPKPGDRYVWHPLALVVAELCGKGELHGALSSNIFSFGSTGSRVPYLEKRLQLMADLAESDVPDLKLIALKVSDELKSEIEREKKNDAQRAAGIHAW